MKYASLSVLALAIAPAQGFVPTDVPQQQQQRLKMALADFSDELIATANKMVRP
eukprot:CAMPEP_0119548646 /NCGR_PEP_ID=MMETSP1352-20130426/2517_1 /TAXON_ID=265584 /ORGANISM="Stauroneis constricta, Strain CCMP1120" /LENGTH=53 /DNA_ID=CAMNT_0007593967 /DNA_START=29 /DNA_END=186 /DNA_ORIENTATION=+